MDRTKKALEAENEQLWRKLEDVYEQLGELLDAEAEEEELYDD